MRLVLLSAILFCACVAAAQAPASKAQPPQTPRAPKPTAEEAELIRLSNEWMEAVVKHDFEKLDALMAPEFSLTGWDGSRKVPRARWLDNVRNMMDPAFDYKIIGARIFGDLGVVYSVGDFTFKLNGKPNANPGVLTDVWQRRDGKWMVVARRSLRFMEIKTFMDQLPERPTQ